MYYARMMKKRDKTENLVLQILDTAAALERRLDSALSLSRGITFREYRLLNTLAHSANNGLTRVALARSASLTPSAVTRALKPLEKLGYVTTTKSDRDARQSLATLTRGGKTLLADVDGVLTDFFVGLDMPSKNQAEIEELLEILTRLRRR
tara:strand:- start:32616 stop:33068 length:453 start_codon:yes stop_codon:yes gene_type:complete